VIKVRTDHHLLYAQFDLVVLKLSSLGLAQKVRDNLLVGYTDK
jgi:hypothetical protein